MERETLQLLAGLAHDLRTPLSAISGHSSLLAMGLHGPLSPEQAESIRRIQDNQKQLTALIGRFLNYAEAASGTITIAPEHCDIGALLEQAISELDEECTSRGVRIDWEHKGTSHAPRDERVEAEPPTAFADPRATSVVIATLLEDALAHCEGDSVIHVRVQSMKDMLHLTVDSAGRPIAADAVEHVFVPYIRDASGRSVCESGRSLSLPHARALARAMGGDVSAVPSDLRRILRLCMDRCANLRARVG